MVVVYHGYGGKDNKCVVVVGPLGLHQIIT
jgi:hypothetical protein